MDMLLLWLGTRSWRLGNVKAYLGVESSTWSVIVRVSSVEVTVFVHGLFNKFVNFLVEGIRPKDFIYISTVWKYQYVIANKWMSFKKTRAIGLGYSPFDNLVLKNDHPPSWFETIFSSDFHIFSVLHPGKMWHQNNIDHSQTRLYGIKTKRKGWKWAIFICDLYLLSLLPHVTIPWHGRMYVAFKRSQVIEKHDFTGCWGSEFWIL